MVIPKRFLGKTDVEITPLGLGGWQFAGDEGGLASYWSTITQAEINAIVMTALKGGINWFDTAEIYGFGNSEQALAQALQNASKKEGDVLIATKWWPAFRFAGSIKKTIGQRINSLRGYPIDLHQIHQPWSFSSVEAEMNVMADLVEEGTIRAVGVSNFSPVLVDRAAKQLALRGIPLASHQTKYSLLDRSIEFNGILENARKIGCSIIAYSPLEQGLITGKFHGNPERTKQLSGFRRWRMKFSSAAIEKSRPIIQALGEIADTYGATPAQVALSWLINFHGECIVAIPGASKAEQVEDNVKALQLVLTSGEMQRLDRLSREYRL
ncbi:aldo/keto reductase [bacterium]|nr:aldo/keto reductase [bacterium]